MKTDADVLKVVQCSHGMKVLIIAKRSIGFIFSNPFKKLIFIAGITGFGLFLNSCVGGYVSSEPVYVEYSRPAPPSNVYIWRTGDWGWNNQSHVYVQRAGYWEKPRQGQTFVGGHWQSTSKGKSWSKGYWQKDNSNRNNHRR